MRHGTHGGYAGGCRCEECKAAHLAYYHQRTRTALLEEIGERDSYFMDAEPVRRHVAHLLKRGATKRGICAASGVSRTTMHNLMNYKPSTGRPIERIKRETGEHLMALKPSDVDGRTGLCSGCGKRRTGHHTGFCTQCRAVYLTGEEARRAKEAARRAKYREKETKRCTFI